MFLYEKRVRTPSTSGFKILLDFFFMKKFFPFIFEKLGDGKSQFMTKVVRKGQRVKSFRNIKIIQACNRMILQARNSFA